MRRTNFVFCVVALLVVMACGIVLAADKKATVKQDASAQQIVEKQVIEQGIATFYGREWVIYMVGSGQSTGKKIPAQTDILTFKDGQVSSKNLTAEGFSASNFTPSLMDNTIVVWETMQSNEVGDLAFFRGELRGNAMVGFISMHPKKGGVTEYTFTTNQPQAAAAAPKKK